MSFNLDNLLYFAGIIWTVVYLFKEPLKATVRLLKANVRNKNVQFACNMAEQAITAVANSQLTSGPAKKAAAVKMLAERLHANNIGQHFTEPDLEQYIQTTYDKMNAEAGKVSN
ncbi:phage holin, LLH family [Eupransor demetentiae]|uniref:Uncharacterized protein n=1 Tax=Eupransor demetentiae TaxID=3109584 RepID=A0ABM9N4K4_9LACO|nr:hypothetical protein R54876_GBNLAHCA_00668 [Lactobacillaceae bacterium LMG 33000]